MNIKSEIAQLTEFTRKDLQYLEMSLPAYSEVERHLVKALNVIEELQDEVGKLKERQSNLIGVTF